MGRGRGKGKKLTVSGREDPASGGEENLFAQKQGGSAPQPLKDEIKEEKSGKVEAVNDHVKTVSSKAMIKSPSLEETGKKRKRNSPVKEKLDLVDDEKCNGIQTSIVEVKSNGSRRKSKPRRAAEAVVECR